MKVFKFGGASVKDYQAVKNVGNILNRFPNENIIIVVSAMGKITNALEGLVNSYFQKKNNSQIILSEIKDFHFNILNNLFSDKNHIIFNEINNAFIELDWALEDEPTTNYNFEYDKIVCIGEIISSKIISSFLNFSGINNNWLDVRDVIKTDNTYREGKVDWQITSQLAQQYFKESKGITVTQGFIGGTSENFTTTLGREGSDYTAAILAFVADAENVTIWKDVSGVLNADPKYFEDTKKLDQISYQDAIELAYYGASVIHPKTIKPLQNKKISLYVKSFLNPEMPGTIINGEPTLNHLPCFIFKINQVLISISPKDFSFIVEENFVDIFNYFAKHQVKINVMQNSAISFSVSVDNDEQKLNSLINTLQKDYRVLYNDNLELITIRYYDQQTIERVSKNKIVLLEVKSRHTVQLVVKNN